MELHPLAKICPGGPSCSGLGTCNLFTGVCSCAFGWGGDDCTRDLVPACRMPLAPTATDARNLTNIHLLYSHKDIEHRIPKGDPWGVLSVSGKMFQNWDSYHWHGPRSCECLRQLFSYSRLVAPQPRGLVYACLDDDVQAYLQAPEHSRFASAWKYIDLHTLEEMPYVHVKRGGKVDWTQPLPAQIPRASEAVAPLAQCPNACSGLGYCQRDRDSFRCKCYAEVGTETKDGGCERVEVASSRCLSYCAGKGQCKLGFCICQPGFFGADCALTLHPNITDRAVPYVARAKSPIEKHVPLWYMYDMPAQYSLPYSAGRRIEKFIRYSRYRTGDPSKASYFWIAQVWSGPTLLGLLRWIEKHDPFFLQSVNNKFANFIITNTFDHGFASGFLPNQGWDIRNHREYEAYGKYWHPNSADRLLLSYQLNGRVDGVESGFHKCFICFQKSKDVAVPPQPWDLDGAGNTHYAGHVKVRDYFKYSPWRKGLDPAQRWPPRKYLLFFATSANSDGFPVTGRKQLKPFVKDRRFLLRGKYYSPQTMGSVKGSLSATFCYAPFGQIGGYTGRYVHAVQFGCIPVWFVPDKMDRGLPFEPVLRKQWEAASVIMHERDIPDLPAILGNFTEEQIAAKREALQQLWEPMLFSTIPRPIWQEDGRRDAVHYFFLSIAKKADDRFGTKLQEQMLATLPEWPQTYL